MRPDIVVDLRPEPVCMWHPDADEDGEPIGPMCGRPATHVIVWPQTQQWSPLCSDPLHHVLDDDAPEHSILPLSPP